MRLKIFILASVFFFTSNAFAAPLTPPEKQIRDDISTHQAEALSLLEKLVNINSGTTNIPGVKRIGEILRPQFAALGFKTYWVEEPANMNRAPTLIAEKQGTKGQRLLLIGHLDTVFPKESTFQHFQRQNNIATGPGVIDDKGGDIVILYALKALQKVRALDNATITVVLTGDEEDSGKPTLLSRQSLFDAAKKSDIALDFEWSISPDTATIARRGISSWTITTQGNEAHSSEIFQTRVGNGAIFEMARILNSMRTEMSGEQYLTFNPGLTLGGGEINFDADKYQGTVSGKKNVVAKMAIANGDLRYLTQAQQKTAQEKILAISKQNLPGTSASVIFREGIPGMEPTKNNEALLEKLSAVSEDLGGGKLHAVDPGARGAGDISHISKIVSANLAGLGPVGTGAHSEKETLQIDSLPIATQRAALLMFRLLN